jgi:hypothetical protein
MSASSLSHQREAPALEEDPESVGDEGPRPVVPADERVPPIFSLARPLSVLDAAPVLWPLV